jgi:preprotein translocase SecE subunit
MALAVKNNPETKPRSPNTHLALASLVGAVFVLASIVVVFYGVPQLWRMVVGDALENIGATDWFLSFLLCIATAVGLGFLGKMLAGPNPPVGLRTGIALTIAAMFVAFEIAVGVGQFLLDRGMDPTNPLGLLVEAVVGVGLLGLYMVWLRKPQGYRFVTAVEGQGWFQFARYKRMQGLRARRLTMLGMIALTAWGVMSLWNSPMRQAWPDNWYVTIPFSNLSDPLNNLVFTLLPSQRYAIPVILFALGLWFAFRAVNFPLFADFLIATEAEINKVSWSSRRKLIQDTIVVLTTVLLFTLYLLFVDQFWGFALSRIGILPNSADAANKAAAKAQEEERSIPW